jgi:hypothetical protein
MEWFWQFSWKPFSIILSEQERGHEMTSFCVLNRFNPDNFDYYSSGEKRGLKVNHANTGKNTIGTASPGNNSGFFTVKGREIEIGMMTAAKDRIEINRLKTILLFFLEVIVKK